MINEIPFIHLFNTYNGNYMYDVNTNLVVKIPLNIYKYLEQAVKNPENADNTQDEEILLYISKLKQNGLLSPKTVDIIRHPDDDSLEYHLDSKLNMLTLQVTQNCNLRCAYCAYMGEYFNRTYSNKHMPYYVAQKSIDFLIQHSSDTNDVSIGFYGGEPLLELDLIEKCVEYAKIFKDTKKIRYSITTNGTIFDRRTIEFLKDNEFNVLISLDGPKESHDRNRVFSDGRGSYDKIVSNLEFIKNKYPDFYKKISFNMVIDPKSDFTCLNEFVSDNEFINESLFMASSVNPFYKKDDSFDYNEYYTQMRYYEKFKYFLFALGKLDSKFTSRIAAFEFGQLISKLNNNNYFTCTMPDEGHPGGPCIPGAAKLFVDVEGNFYPCEKVSEKSELMKIGSVYEGFNIKKIRKLLNLCSVNENVCKQCWAFRQCGICACQVDDLKDISKNLLCKGCVSRKNVFENTLKDYCALNEFGYKL